MPIEQRGDNVPGSALPACTVRCCTSSALTSGQQPTGATASGRTRAGRAASPPGTNGSQIRSASGLAHRDRSASTIAGGRGAGEQHHHPVRGGPASRHRDPAPTATARRRPPARPGSPTSSTTPGGRLRCRPSSARSTPGGLPPGSPHAAKASTSAARRSRGDRQRQPRPGERRARAAASRPSSGRPYDIIAAQPSSSRRAATTRPAGHRRPNVAPSARQASAHAVTAPKSASADTAMKTAAGASTRNGGPARDRLRVSARSVMSAPPRPSSPPGR